jgi:hypothetical protein
MSLAQQVSAGRKSRSSPSKILRWAPGKEKTTTGICSNGRGASHPHALQTTKRGRERTTRGKLPERFAPTALRGHAHFVHFGIRWFREKEEYR